MTVLQIFIATLVIVFALSLIVICIYGVIDADKFSSQMKEWDKKNEEFKKEFYV